MVPEAAARSADDLAAGAADAGAPALSQVDNDLHAVDASFRPYYQRAMLANRVGALVPLRMMLNEYFMVSGKFPSTEREFRAEFGADSLAPDDDFTRLSVLGSGGIQALLAPPFEDGQYVALIPQVSKRGSTIKWKCRTNLPQSVVGPRSAAVCESVGSANGPPNGVK